MTAGGLIPGYLHITFDIKLQIIRSGHNDVIKFNFIINEFSASFNQCEMLQFSPTSSSLSANLAELSSGQLMVI